MRFGNSIAAVLSAILILVNSPVLAQEAASSPIMNYKLISERHAGTSQWYVTYRAELKNDIQPNSSLAATVTSTAPSVKVLPGQGKLHFGRSPAGAQASSRDTFTLLVDRSVPFSFSNLRWSFQSPSANAGRNQTVAVGAKVRLNGSQSSDASDSGSLSYSWSFLSKPAGSSAVLLDENSTSPSFAADAPGDYEIQLKVGSGISGDVSTVSISTNNSAPMAMAGRDQTVALGSRIALNGSGSLDVDGDPLGYTWTMVSQPEGSNAIVENLQSALGSFTADKSGTYVLQLVVNDGLKDSTPSTVTFSTANSAPVARAGNSISANVDSAVRLNGSTSTDGDGDTITYKWRLISAPTDSEAELSSPNAINPELIPDVPGTYIAQLIVDDGQMESAPSTVTITTEKWARPFADPGPNQTVSKGALVQLQGSGERTREVPLNFNWSLLTKPAGSQAILTNARSKNASFLADQPGTYIAQLITHDGLANSEPKTIVISTVNTVPVANPGAYLKTALHSNVSLKADQSSDADGDSLTYFWALLSRPAGSRTFLISPNSKDSAFVPDAEGTYVVQLIVNDSFASSEPVTTAIIVGAEGSTPREASSVDIIVPSTMTIAPGDSVLYPLSLASPAASSVFVQLTSSDATKAVIGTTGLTINAGQTTPSRGANLIGLAAGTATISASAVGMAPASTLVTVGVSASLSPANATLTAVGSEATLLLTLSAPVAFNTTFTLSSSNTAVAIVPSSLLLNASTQIIGFRVTATGLGTTVIRASAPGFADATSNVTVGGNTPASVTVSSGSGQTATINSPFTNQLVALVRDASTNPIPNVTVTFANVASGAGIASTVTALTNASGLASASVAANATAGGPYIVAATVVGVASPANFSLTNIAVAGGGTIGLPSGVVVAPGQTVPFTVTLPTAAPVGGVTVSLLSGDTSKVSVFPASVSIGAGLTQPAVQPQVTGVNFGSASISASASGYTTGSQSVTVTATISFSPANLSIAAPGSQNLSLNLSAPAPTGGLTFTLSSSNTAKATVPASVTMTAGATTVTVPVTAVAAGSSVITASLAGLTNATANITVTSATSGDIVMPAAMTIAPSTTVDFPIVLARPAATTTYVELFSSDPSKATITPGVTFNAGQTTPSRSVTLNGVGLGTTTITAVGPGLASATSLITVGLTASLAPSNIILAGPGSDATLTLTLSGPAQPNTNFTLTSSNPSVAIVPNLIAFSASSQVIGFKVTAMGQGTTVIRASAPGFADVTANVSVQPPNSISMVASTTSIKLAQAPATVTVTLSQPAPFGGTTVTLGFDNRKINCVPSTIVIPRGATSGTTSVFGETVGNFPLTASASGYASPAPLTMLVGADIAWETPNVTLSTVGQQLQFNLLLFATVPGSNAFSILDGIPINISSSNPSVATVQTPVNFFWDGSTVPATRVTIDTLGFGTTQIHASGVNIAEVVMNLTIGSGSPLSVTTNSLPTGTVGTPYSFNMGAAGGVAPYRWTATGLPAGLSISTGGAITGTPTSAGTSAATFNVTDSSTVPLSASKFLNLTVSGNAPASVTVSTGSGQSATVNTPFTNSLVALVKDSGNNPVPNVTVTFANAAGGAGIASTVTAITNLSGLASALVSANATTGGPYTVAASVIGVAAPANFSLTNTAAASGGIIGLPSGVVLTPGQSAPFPVTLPSAAPVGGVTVALSSGDTSKVTISPSSVTIGAGLTQPAAQPQVTGVNFGTASISASASGYTTGSQPVNVTATISFSPATLSIVAPGSQNLTLNLSAPAPVGGLTFAISSSNTAAATVPVSVSMGAGATTTTVSVTGVAAGSSIIRASLAGLTDATANVTVTGGGTVDFIIPSTLTVGPNASIDFPITLARPAATTISAQLISSDPLKATVTSNVTFNAGQTTPSRTVILNSTALGTTTITATAPGLTTASTLVTVGLSASLSPANVTLLGAGSDTTLTLTLSGPAQSNTTFTLTSSNPSVAIVGPYVTFTASSQVIGFRLTAISQGTTVIRASAPGFTDVTTNVTVAPSPTITLTANTTSVNLAQPPATITATLSQPAPFGGTIVTLGFDNRKINCIPTSILIPQGATSGTSLVSGENVGNYSLGASAPGYSSASPITMQVGATIGWETPNVTLNSIGQQLQFNLLLFATVPGSNAFSILDGIPINISSSNTSIATVQTPVNFFWDGSTVPATRVTVNIIGAGTTQIHASGVNIADVVMNLTVTGPVNVTTSSLPSGGVGIPYSFTMSAAGGVAPYSWTAIGLPAGLSISPAGVITGTPTAPGSSSAVLTVRDSSSSPQTANATLNLNISAAVPASITASAGSGQTAAINTAFSNQLVALVKDGSNNPLPGFTVSFAGPGSGAGIASTVTAVTNGSGLASVNVSSNATAGGPYTVNATVPGVSTPATFSLTNTNGSAGSITVSSGSGQNVTVGTAFAPIVALVKDAGNNPVPNATVTFASPGSGASATLSSSTAITNAAGLASITPTANTTAGTYAITASVAGAASPASFSLTNNAGAPASVTMSSGSPQSASVNTAFGSSLTALVRDAFNNPVTGATVAYAAGTSGAASATLSSLTATTNASGLASVTATANASVGGPYTVSASVAGVGATAPFLLTNTAAASGGVIGLPSGVVLAPAQTAAFAVTLLAPAATNVTVSLSSSDTAKVTISPSSVLILAGQTTPASQPQVTGVNFGTASISASASGYTTGTKSVTVTATISFTPATLAINTGSTQNLTLNLSAPAPVGGLSFTLSSSTASATVPSPVNMTAGATTVAVPVTGASVGSAVITASFSGLTNATANVTVSTSNVPSSISVQSGSPQTASINTVFAGPLKALVKDSGNNPVPNVTVTFTAPGSGASGTFAGGVTTALTDAAGVATSAAFTANGTTGSYNVVASAGALSTNFALTNSGSFPFIFTITRGSGQSTLINTPFGEDLVVKVIDAVTLQPAPRGTFVDFAAPGSGASANFPAPGPRAFTDGLGEAHAVVVANGTLGTYNVTATLAGQPSLTFELTNSAFAGGNGTITVGNVTIGKDLQASVLITFSPVAPAGGVPVTIASSSGAQILLGGSSAGRPTLVATLSEGLNSLGTSFQALAGTGTATVTITAPGYTTAISTVTMTPSGFVLAPNASAVGTPFTVFQGATTPLTVFAVKLDAGNNPTGVQQLRGGLSVIVPLTISSPGLGSTNPAQVIFNGGDDSATAQFVASGSGTGVTNITATPPFGFNTPASGGSVTATVLGSGLIPFTAMIGKNLQTVRSVGINGSAVAGVTATVTSLNPSKLLFSSAVGSPGVVGSSSIEVIIPPNQSNSSTFNVQGFGDPGVVGYTVTAPGFSTINGTVTIVPAAIRINSPGGVGAGSFISPVGFGGANISVETGRADGGFAESQVVAGGTSVQVILTSSNTGIATISSSPITIVGGTGIASTLLQPLGSAGSTTVTATASFGSTSATAQVVANFSIVPLFLTGNLLIGKSLQAVDSVSLPQPAGPGGVVVTITTASPSIKFSSTANAAGTSTLFLTVPQGSQGASFFVQSLTDTGTATYTASSPGLGSSTATATFAASGIVILTNDTFSSSITGTVGQTSNLVSIFTALLDGSNTPTTQQALAGGAALNVSLTNGGPTKITIPASVAIQPGTSSAAFPITFVASTGLSTVNITVVKPSAFALPNKWTAVAVTVN